MRLAVYRLGVAAGAHSLPVAQPSLSGDILRHMKIEEIAEAVARLPPDQLARFRRWFTAFAAGRNAMPDLSRREVAASESRPFRSQQ
jgi:hypothetical protein